MILVRTRAADEGHLTAGAAPKGCARVRDAHAEFFDGVNGEEGVSAQPADGIIGHVNPVQCKGALVAPRTGDFSGRCGAGLQGQQLIDLARQRRKPLALGHGNNVAYSRVRGLQFNARGGLDLDDVGYFAEFHLEVHPVALGDFHRKIRNGGRPESLRRDRDLIDTWWHAGEGVLSRCSGGLCLRLLGIVIEDFHLGAGNGRRLRIGHRAYNRTTRGGLSSRLARKHQEQRQKHYRNKSAC